MTPLPVSRAARLRCAVALVSVVALPAVADSYLRPESYVVPVGDRYEFAMLAGSCKSVPVQKLVSPAEFQALQQAERRSDAKTPADYCRTSLSSGSQTAEGWRVVLDERRMVYQPANGHTRPGLYARGSDEPLWTVDWYARGVEVSPDGRYLVRPGPWASSFQQDAVSFYDRGRLLKEYSIDELVVRGTEMPTSTSHFSWAAGPRNDFGRLRTYITTIDEQSYEFDITTGEIVKHTGPAPDAFDARLTMRDGRTLPLRNFVTCGGSWFEALRSGIGREAALRFVSLRVPDASRYERTYIGIAFGDIAGLQATDVSGELGQEYAATLVDGTKLTLLHLRGEDALEQCGTGDDGKAYRLPWREIAKLELTRHGGPAAVPADAVAADVVVRRGTTLHLSNFRACGSGAASLVTAKPEARAITGVPSGHGSVFDVLAVPFSELSAVTALPRKTPDAPLTWQLELRDGRHLDLEVEMWGGSYCGTDGAGMLHKLGPAEVATLRFGR